MTITASPAYEPRRLLSASLFEAQRALEETDSAADPSAAREKLRRALFHDRLPLIEMAGDAYLVLRDALLAPADDDFARRCDVVAAVMVARAEGRLRLSLEAAVAESLAGLNTPTRKSAATWLLGQLFDDGRPRVELADPAETAERLRRASAE